MSDWKIELIRDDQRREHVLSRAGEAHVLSKALYGKQSNPDPRLPMSVISG